MKPKVIGVLLTALAVVLALTALGASQLRAQENGIALHGGWNLIAIPYTEGEFSVEQLLRGVKAQVYTWDPNRCSYVEVDTLEAGRGYWIYVEQPTSIHLKPQLQLLVEGDYYSKVLPLLKRANSSIYVAMFSMKYDPDDEYDPANVLINALVSAAERGVEVLVVLDDYPWWNEQTAEYLENHGVEVHIYAGGETMHAKVVVIDSKIVVLGSHNWSESGLAYNREVSLLIRSSSMAEYLANYIASLAAS